MKIGALGFWQVAQPLKIGDMVELYPSHICTTINLHDKMFVTSDDEVVDVWEIKARGKSQ